VSPGAAPEGERFLHHMEKVQLLRTASREREQDEATSSRSMPPHRVRASSDVFEEIEAAVAPHVQVTSDSPWLRRVKVMGVISLMLLFFYTLTLAIEDDWITLFGSWAKEHLIEVKFLFSFILLRPRKLAFLNIYFSFAVAQASACIILLFIPAALMFVPVDMPLYLIAGFMSVATSARRISQHKRTQRRRGSVGNLTIYISLS
jgi:hypothetical protein